MAGEGALPGALPFVAGRRELDGWAVWLSVLGVAVSMPPARARQLAQDILDMCDVLEDGPPGVVTELSAWTSPGDGPGVSTSPPRLRSGQSGSSAGVSTSLDTNGPDMNGAR
jgi:hypothetical protein